MHQPRLGTPVIVADIVQQLPVLTGVVIGALASYLVSSATERAQWRRQQAARWDDKRIQVYADYGYSVKNVYIACLRIVENRGLNTKSVPTDPQVFGEFERLATERTAKMGACALAALSCRWLVTRRLPGAGRARATRDACLCLAVSPRPCTGKRTGTSRSAWKSTSPGCFRTGHMLAELQVCMRA
jgi:hypothetical protein